ncbi:hypothetical protein ACIQUQ_30235 [Streptomyces sp. NPDC101118]|uniref:hypothetical protein n=1 Tax=Streptomyces sp. NPDC101118 TaxID=3366109 RepID=UPI00381EA30D
MATWREQLAEADGWKGYRTALRTLREGGPVFEELPDRSLEIAKKVPGLRGYSKSAFAQLLAPQVPDTRPDWPKVELVVRICAEHQGVENVTAFVRLWADAYRGCGGDPGERFAPAPQQEQAPAAPTPTATPTPAPDPMVTLDTPTTRPKRPWRKSKPVVGAAVLLATAALVLGSIEINLYLNQRNDGAQPPVGPTGPSQSAGTKATGPATGRPGTTKDPKQSPGPSAPAKTSRPPGSIFSAHVAWSDDGGGGGSTADTVNVSSSYRRDDPSPQRIGTLNRTDAITVTCQESDGRTIGAGPAYPGPATAKERDAKGIWYRITDPVTGWIPGVYVDTGRDSLPAC